jgi:hypothetical protein
VVGFGGFYMPDIKIVIPVVIGVAVLVLFASGLGWLLMHPGVLIVSALVVGGGLYLLARRRAQRNRV